LKWFRLLQTLSDESKRAAYDKYGAASQQPGFDPDAFNKSPFGSGGFGGFQDFSGGFGGAGGRAGNPNDLFESLFGAFGGRAGAGMGGGPGMGGRNVHFRGEDIESSVTISFLESCSGTSKTLTVYPIVECKTCTGSGLKKGEKRTTCTVCRGTGQQTFSLQGMMMASTCQACGGSGSQIPPNAKCGSCDGVGRVKEKKTVKVDIPGGVYNGSAVALRLRSYSLTVNMC
jgi:molecular chaperone DnaJ